MTFVPVYRKISVSSNNSVPRTWWPAHHPLLFDRSMRLAHASPSEVRFPVTFVAAGNRRMKVMLNSICGPDDDGSPCITIMFEDED